MKRLLVVAPNWLGDAVMALPALADVRRAYADATVAVAARRSIAPLFSMVAGVDEVIAFDRQGPFPFSGFDAALLLPNSFHTALTVARAGIPERWGYRTDWRGFLLTRAVPRAPDGLHQIDYYQHLAHALDVPSGPKVPRIDVPAAARDSGARLLRTAGWDGRAPLVAIAPGAAYGSAKRWPPASFAEVAAGLAADGVATVVIGSAADRATAREVVAATGDRARLVDVVGQTDLPTLAGVLSSCRTLVSNDSGAMHLGAAIGIDVTAVFGPTNERATAPMADAPRQHVAVLTHTVWCRPCMLRECPLDHACMRGVGAPAVLDAARRWL